MQQLLRVAGGAAAENSSIKMSVPAPALTATPSAAPLGHPAVVQGPERESAEERLLRIPLEAAPSSELASQDFQTAMDRMLASANGRRAQAAQQGSAEGRGDAARLQRQPPPPAALSETQREANIKLLAADYQCAMDRLREEAAVLGVANSVPPTAGLEQMLDQLRKEQAALAAELHRRRLERQNHAIQGELETETLLAQLQRAQLEERHQELRGELQRTGRGRTGEASMASEEQQQATSGAKATSVLAPAKRRPSNAATSAAALASSSKRLA